MKHYIAIISISIMALFATAYLSIQSMDGFVIEREVSVPLSLTDNSKRVFVVNYIGEFNVNNSEDFARKMDYIVQNYKQGDELLMRIESPGGSYSACRSNHDEVEMVKSIGVNVTSVSNYIAASCGYMIASSADKVYASSGAQMGNIGSYTRVNTKKLPIIGNTRKKELMAGDMPLSKIELDFLRSKAKRVGDDFINLVKANRVDVIEQALDGDTFFGVGAVKVGLIDEIKTYNQTVLSFTLNGFTVIELVIVK